MTDEERKLLPLVRELFLWLRELMPATPEHTRRQSEFAARLQNLIEGRKTNEGS
jgi:hypothetical protein